MIEKERLEELIKNADKNSIIWGVTDYTYHKSKLELRIDHFEIYYMPTFYKNNIDKLFENYNNTEFFETKEEAEWYLEFGNITRTETLKLPTWEEVERDLYGKTGDFWIADNFYFIFIYDKRDFNSQIILRTKDENYNWSATKENYNEACKMAKKIFLGEKV